MSHYIVNFREVPELSTLESYLVLPTHRAVFTNIPEGYEIDEGLGRIGENPIVSIRKIEELCEDLLPSNIMVQDLRNDSVSKERIIKSYSTFSSFLNQPYFHKSIITALRKDVCNIIMCPPTETGMNMRWEQEEVKFSSSNNAIIYVAPQVMPIAVYDEENKRVVAQMSADKNLVYLHCYNPTIATLKWIARQLSQATPGYPSDDTKEITDLYEKKTLEEINKIDNNILSIKESVAKLSQQILEQTKKISGNLKAKKLIEDTFRETKDKVINEIEKIKSLPAVYQAHFNNYFLHIETIPILVKYGTDKTKFLGRYSVMINVNSGDIKLRNLDMLVIGKAHPHSFTDGNVCLGTLSDGVAKLLGQNELSAAATMVLAFLQQFNLSDPEGAKAIWWPDITDESGEETFKFRSKSDIDKCHFFNKYIAHGAPYAEYKANCIYS